jgi:hypothetical protein
LWSWANYIRATRWGGGQNDESNGIAVDSDLNTYIAWNFEWTAEFWTTTLNNNGNWYTDIFIAKVSSTGQYLRAVKWWGTGQDYVKWVVVDSQWNSYVAWYFQWTSTFGNIVLTSNGGNLFTDFFIAKISSTWEFLRAKSWWGTGFHDQVGWLALDSDWNIYIDWMFGWSADFWSTTLISNWSQDIFTAKLSSTWEYIWATKWWRNSGDYNDIINW